MRTWHWPEKICEHCGNPYIPTGRDQRFCSPKHYGVWLGKAQAGRDMREMSRKRMVTVRAKARQRIRAEFGTLTDREQALVKLALSKGYQKGYKVARRLNDREAEAA